jgi:hypothetical protein
VLHGSKQDTQQQMHVVVSCMFCHSMLLWAAAGADGSKAIIIADATEPQSKAQATRFLLVI